MFLDQPAGHIRAWADDPCGFAADVRSAASCRRSASRIHDDGRVFFIWPARDGKTGDRVQVQVEVTSIRPDAVAEQLKPTRRSIELAARELYHPGTGTVRLMRSDTNWLEQHSGAR